MSTKPLPTPSHSRLRTALAIAGLTIVAAGALAAHPPGATAVRRAASAVASDVGPPDNHKVLGADELVNIDVVNECGASASGFRFVLADFQPPQGVALPSAYNVVKTYETPCPNPNPGADACNPFTPPAVVTPISAGPNDTITLGWTESAGELASGATGHFGYTLKPIHDHLVTAQLTTGITQTTILCDAAAYWSTWRSVSTTETTTVTMTVRSAFQSATEVELRGGTVAEPIALEDLIPSNAALMRRLPEPLAAAVLAPGQALTVSLPVTGTDRAVVVRADWYDHGAMGQRGPLRARAFHARELMPVVPPVARLYLPWVGRDELLTQQAEAHVGAAERRRLDDAPRGVE